MVMAIGKQTKMRNKRLQLLNYSMIQIVVSQSEENNQLVFTPAHRECKGNEYKLKWEGKNWLKGSIMTGSCTSRFLPGRVLNPFSKGNLLLRNLLLTLAACRPVFGTFCYHSYLQVFLQLHWDLWKLSSVPWDSLSSGLLPFLWLSWNIYAFNLLRKFSALLLWQQQYKFMEDELWHILYFTGQCLQPLNLAEWESLSGSHLFLSCEFSVFFELQAFGRLTCMESLNQCTPPHSHLGTVTL